MKGDCDDLLAREEKRKLRLQDTARGKVNTLLSEVLEQDEEIELYKCRLKELETAFYYNLELISERDAELTLLEEQLATESEKLQEVIRERHELEELVKIIDEKSNRKIQQLETRLSLKEREIKELHRENAANISTLKRLVEDIRQQQEKKLHKMSAKYESEKSELVKRYKEEIEEKEKYYLLELDALAGKLEQVRREKDELAAVGEENKNLKCHLRDAEKHFLEKESHYLEKIRELNKSCLRKLSREVQCDFKPKGAEKIIQARPDVAEADAQTTGLVPPEMEDQYVRRINFLQEQNEVLKCVVKDLKRNRDAPPREPGQPPGCEFSAMRTEIEQVNKKFENEVNNLKKILQEELQQRAEEDAVIQSLEASVTCLKEKLLLRLQERLGDFEGQDICAYTYNREIQNEIQVTLLDQKLSRRIESLVKATQQEMQNVHEKLEKLRRECAEKKQKFEKHQQRLTDFESENHLEKIRQEKQRLENKIEANAMNNNSGSKIFQTRLEFPAGLPNDHAIPDRYSAGRFHPFPEFAGSVLGTASPERG